MTTEYEMIGWHHRLDGHEFEQVLGVGDGQVSLSMGSQRVGFFWSLCHSECLLCIELSSELRFMFVPCASVASKDQVGDLAKMSTLM